MYNPLNIHTERCNLDWTKGTLRVVEDSSFSVFLLEEEDGNILVLNVIKKD